MSSPEILNESEELSDVIVTLNITETNITMNGSRGRTFMKTPDQDTSINNIILGIGAVFVILIVILIIIKLIHKCYKIYKSDDNEDDTKDSVRKSPLLPSTSSNVIRRKSSIRDPSAAIHRSSLNIETQMEIRQKRLSQTYSNTPPIIRNP